MAPETAQEANLSLTKSVNDPTPNVGDTITYIVTISNAGPNSATNVQVRDQLPERRVVRVGHAQPGDV